MLISPDWLLAQCPLATASGMHLSAVSLLAPFAAGPFEYGETPAQRRRRPEPAQSSWADAPHVRGGIRGRGANSRAAACPEIRREEGFG